MAPDRNGVGKRERDDQVDDEKRERAAAEHVVPLPLEDQRGAEDPEDRSGSADRDRIRVEQERAGGAGETRDQVERQEATAAESFLDGGADDPEHDHVQGDVEEAAVQEGGGDEPPPLAVGEPAPR